MNPTLERLARYAEQELSRGVPESTLQADLSQSGWTADWITAALRLARQRVMPDENALTIPQVQPHFIPPAPRPMPVQRQPQSPPLKVVTPKKVKKPAFPIKKFMLIVVGILTLAFVAALTYRVNITVQQKNQQRVLRDEERRNDLAGMLNGLSDYYVLKSSYPTDKQMADTKFLQENDFTEEIISDPSSPTEACNNNGQPKLANDPAPGCYSYKALTSKNEACDNKQKQCTRVKVSITLEEGKKLYAVTFDKNIQVSN